VLVLLTLPLTGAMDSYLRAPAHTS
jgi:hypothetical protein